MLNLNRDSVLKAFLEKVKEAKRLNMKDVKMTMKEMDDLFQVVYELMTEQISNALITLEAKKEQDVKKTDSIIPKKRKVIEEIKIEKEPEVNKTVQVSNQVSEQVKSVQQPIIVQQLPKVQPIPINVVVEEEPEEEEDDNTLYGGTW